MRIDVKKTELQNVLDHVNEINEWDIQDKDIRKIIPYVRFPLPEFYVEAQAGQHDWNGRNTYLELAPAALKYRWSRESQVYYRRIHIGLQLDVYLKDRAARGETGKITVWYDVDKNPFPTIEEFETAMNLLGPWRFESIETNVIDVVDKGYEYPIEGTLDARANNSLICSILNCSKLIVFVLFIQFSFRSIIFYLEIPSFYLYFTFISFKKQSLYCLQNKKGSYSLPNSL